MIHWDANLFHFNYKIICKYQSKISEHNFFLRKHQSEHLNFLVIPLKKNSQYLCYISSFHLLNKKPLLEIEELG